MRVIVVPVFVVLIFAASSSQPVRAANCLANANKASFELWPPNSIPTGKTVSRMHACGRELVCTGGMPGRAATRLCHWK